MSVLLQEAIAIGKQLSTTEKVQLIQSVSGLLSEELSGQFIPTEAPRPANASTTHREQIEQNGSIVQRKDEAHPTWTEEALQELLKPKPKSGAEIVELLSKLDLSSWQEQDIPDVVEWLQQQRTQSRRLRQAQWDALD